VKTGEKNTGTIAFRFRQVLLYLKEYIDEARSHERHIYTKLCYITSKEDLFSLINDIPMKAQGLVNYNISHCMFRNKLNDRRVVPVTHACNALHESMRTYTLPKKKTLFE
jgi:hypothetical protein